jgi:hypothetical protein
MALQFLYLAFCATLRLFARSLAERSGGSDDLGDDYQLHPGFAHRRAASQPPTRFVTIPRNS